MSSKIRVQRICEHCGGAFEAKTTVTRFCSRQCNSRFYKVRAKELKIANSDKETKLMVSKPIDELRNKEFLSINETCKLLGISRMTLHRQLQRKKISPGRIGRRVIFRKEDLEKLIF